MSHLIYLQIGLSHSVATHFVFVFSFTSSRFQYYSYPWNCVFAWLWTASPLLATTTHGTASSHGYGLRDNIQGSKRPYEDRGQVNDANQKEENEKSTFFFGRSQNQAKKKPEAEGIFQTINKEKDIQRDRFESHIMESTILMVMTVSALRETVSRGLDNVNLFRIRDLWMHIDKVLNGQLANYTVKKYKPQRRIPNNGDG
ncbi:hypothetical protein Glove_123g202 [Diversispora epigaea]|uniref:Uncharacterized protein n=1 Tax=Diversispora epigaea TaxID=1348612 RepID=A0A397IZ18_9GLOM|nr:hypothetical protein Glove_123g202 [Diversispora epigaea]